MAEKIWKSWNEKQNQDTSLFARLIVLTWKLYEKELVMYVHKHANFIWIWLTEPRVNPSCKPEKVLMHFEISPQQSSIASSVAI